MNFIRKSEFSLLKGATVVIFAWFRKIQLLFCLWDIFKKIFVKWSSMGIGPFPCKTRNFFRNHGQSVKSRHQYFRIFWKKVVTIHRDYKAGIGRGNRGNLKLFKPSIFWLKWFLELLCYNYNFTENSVKWQLHSIKTVIFSKRTMITVIFYFMEFSNHTFLKK